jgi:diguanylate cyclase (GGDEF)-like protein
MLSFKGRRFMNVRTLFPGLYQKYLIIPGLVSETGQAVVRILAALSFGVYLFSFERTAVSSTEFTGAAIVCAVYIIFAALCIFAVRKPVLRSEARRALSAFLDQLIFGCALFFGGQILAPLTFVPICMAIGNGLRFGRRHALVSSYLGMLFILGALFFSPFWNSDSPAAIGIALSMLVIPLYTFGLSDPNAFAKEAAEHGKNAAERAKAAAEVTSRTDSLTGLLNQRAFDEKLEQLYQAAVSQHEKCALVILDLDGFKNVNDTCGHSAGDDVLKDVALRLSEALIIPGKIARQGGDEFSIVIRKFSTHESVEAVAKNILESLSHIRAPNGLQIGASIGICYLPIPILMDKSAVYRAADALSYRAKRARGNQFKTSIGRIFSPSGELKLEFGELE